MKLTPIAILYLLLVSSTGYCQRNLMVSTSNRSIYANWDNELILISHKKKCSDLIVITDNGVITPTSDECRYIITPKKIGIANITISKRTSKRALNHIAYSVKEVPIPIPMVASKHGGEIEKKILEIQVGLTMQSDGFHSGLTTASYSIAVIRNQSCLLNKNVSGAYFSDEVKSLFHSLEIGDHILFTNITCKYHDDRLQMLQPLEFIVVE
jgi:hypothetical protein